RIGALPRPAGTLDGRYVRMLRPSYPVRTRRLVLRPFETTDLEALFAYESRADVARYLYRYPRSRAESAAKLQESTTMTTLEQAGDTVRLAVVVAESDQLVGDTTLEWLSSEHSSAEIGYVIHPEHQGRGYAREAAQQLLRLGFDGLGVHRIIGRCEAANTASTALLGKLGMRQEAHLHENEFVK